MWALRDKLVQQSICQGLGALAQGCPTSATFEALEKGSWLSDPDPWLTGPSLAPLWPQSGLHCSRGPGRVTGGSRPTWGLPRSLLLEATCQSCTLTHHRRQGACTVHWGVQSVRPHCRGSEVVGDSLLSVNPRWQSEGLRHPQSLPSSHKMPTPKGRTTLNYKWRIPHQVKRELPKKKKKEIYFITSNFSVFSCF